MTTIINTPSGEHHDGDEGMGVGMILGLVLGGLVVLVLLYVYGWPLLRGDNNPTTTNTYNVTVPNPVTPTPTPAKTN